MPPSPAVHLAHDAVAVTLVAAQAVGPSGRVIAIDLAEGMLERLARKLDRPQKQLVLL